MIQNTEIVKMDISADNINDKLNEIYKKYHRLICLQFISVQYKTIQQNEMKLVKDTRR